MSLLVIPIIFFAVLIKALAGFGAALVAMPFLIALLGLDMAVPAFALTTQASCAIMIWTYRHDLEMASIWHLALPTVIAIPVGVWGARQLNNPLVFRRGVLVLLLLIGVLLIV